MDCVALGKVAVVWPRTDGSRDDGRRGAAARDGGPGGRICAGAAVSQVDPMKALREE